MSYSEWENALVKELKGLPTEEYIKITSYYREMYGDKLDAGMSEEAILTEFGSPKSCAEKIMAENTAENNQDNNVSVPKNSPSPTAAKVKGIILSVLFSLFAGIPLAAALISIIVSMGAVCISGGAGVLASFVYIFIAPFHAVGTGIAAHIGMAIGGVGVCGFLVIGGYFATKYSVIYSYKLMKIIYRGIMK